MIKCITKSKFVAYDILEKVYKKYIKWGVTLKVILAIKVCIVLYLAIMTHWIVFKMLRESKYGKALFKLHSLTYKKGLKGKKVYNLKVAPFIENHKVYLPIIDVAKALGYKGMKKKENGLFTINRIYKKILINDDENIVVIIKGLHERGYRLKGVSKKVDNELMVPINIISDIFDINYEVNKDDEILLK